MDGVGNGGNYTVMHHSQTAFIYTLCWILLHTFTHTLSEIYLFETIRIVQRYPASKYDFI